MEFPKIFKYEENDNFQLAYARARADYGKYLARLEGRVGQNLTRQEGDAAKSSRKDEK